MKNLSHKLYSRVSNALLAFVVAVSSLGAVAPLLFSQTANAVSGVSYTDIGLTGWSTDRTAPSGGSSVETFDGRSTLSLNVDAPSNAASSFYQFEGLKKSIPASSTIKADLYIDSSWPSNVRAGLWGEGYNALNQISAYPILEYNTASANNWRIFDSADPGQWRDVTVSNAVAGWNTIELAINKADSTKTDVYVNGTFIGQSSGDATTSLKTVFVNNYNFGTDDYTVRWSNLQRGLYNPDAPTNLHFMKNGSVTTLANGSYVNYTGVTLYWNTVPNAERYQVRVTDPSGAQQANRYTGWYTFSLDDSSRWGYFGTQQGLWQYEVRTKDATTGLWSEWTTPVGLYFDNVRPGISINSPADAEQVRNGDLLSVTGTDNVELKRVTLNIYSGSNGTGALLQSNSPSVSGTSYTLNVPVSGLADGNYSFKANASDKAGNQISPTLIRNFTVDNTAPTATLSYSPSTATNHSVTVTLTASEPIVQSALPGTWLKVNDTTYKKVYPVNTVQNVTLEDLAGNTGSTTVNIDWIDKTAPVVTFVNPVDGSSFGHNATVNIDATSDDADATYQLTIEGVDVTYNATSTTLPYDWDTTGLASGTYRITVDATDTVGNVGSATSTVTVDNTAPTLAIDPSNGTDTTPLLTGTTTSADDVVTVDGDAAVVSSTANGDGTYRWSYQLPEQTVGSHNLTVVSTDTFGNSTSETATVTVIASEPLNTPSNTETNTPVQTVTITPNNDQGVLGDQTDTPSDEAAQNSVALNNTNDNTDQDVKAASDTNAAGTIFGLAWYWWLIILAVIAAIIAWIVSAYRNRAAQQ